MDEYKTPNTGADAGDNAGDQGGDQAEANANLDNGAGAGDDNAKNNSQANGGETADNANANRSEGGDINYEKKFGESTTENQRLMEIMKANGLDPKTGKPVAGDNNQERGNRIANNDNSSNSDSFDNFTDSELEKAIPGFTYLSADEKDQIRHAKNMAKDVTSLKRMVAEMYDESTFNKELATAIKSEGMELLKEHEEEFRTFAYEEQNLKVPFNHVANSFILKKTRELGAGGNANQEGQTKKPKGMEGSTGGGKELGKNAGGSLEVTSSEAKKLRQEDPRRYNELVKKRKLKITD